MKKNISIYHTIAVVFAAIFLATTGVSARTVSEDEAYNLVSAQITETDANYYICEAADSDSWQFFVDTEPSKAWAHDCYLVTIPKVSDGENVSISKEKLRFPPKMPKRPYKEQKRILKSAAMATQNTTQVVRPAQLQGKIYALIVNGGGNTNTNSEYDWNDCSFLYKTLRNTYGVPKENIELLFNDGGSPFADMLDFDDEMVNSDADFDGDGEDDVTGASTVEEFGNAINRISAKMSNDDMFFLFLKGPADRVDSIGTRLYLWESEDDGEGKNILNKNQLAFKLQPILDKNCLKNIVLAYNYSGDYPTEFKREGVFVTTACGKKQEMTKLHGVPYNDFSYLWISAINRFDPYGESVGSDYDGDGYISMLEAFNNVYERRQFTANPQYYAKSSKFAKMLNMDYIMSSNELYIADNASQNQGWSCLYPTEIWWGSPDIWIRENYDGEEANELIHGNRAIVNVRIHNNSWKESPENQVVNLSWSFNSLGLHPGILIGLEKFGPCATGGFIGSVNVPSIPPFSSKVITMQWQIPTPLKTVMSNKSVPLQSLAICAEVNLKGTIPISQQYPIGINFNRIISVRKNLAINNILIPKSIIVSIPTTGPVRYDAYQWAGLIVRNTINAKTKYDFSIKIVDDNDFNDGQFELRMPLSFYQKWVDSVGTPNYIYFEILDDKVRFPIEDGITFRNVLFDANESVMFDVITHAKTLPMRASTSFDIIMEDHTRNFKDGIRLNIPLDNVLQPMNLESGAVTESQCFRNRENMLQNSLLEVHLRQTVDENEPTSITITDALTAKTIKTVDVSAGERRVDIDMSEVSNGTYIVNLIKNGVIIDNTKIVLK